MCNKRFIAQLLPGIKRTAERLTSEVADKALSALGRRFAGNQSMRVSPRNADRASFSAALL